MEPHDERLLERVKELVPEIAKLPPHFESIYDHAADVLYLTFEPGTEADDSELTSDDILLRYKDGRVIGVTVMHASSRGGVELPS